MTTPPPRLLEIRKYPNRRLYDATRSCHVTLTELYDLVAAGTGVVVRESKTGEDITNQVLLQALIERDPLKIGAVPSPLIHLMIRLNHQLLASWLDLYARRVLEAYQMSPGGAPPWWAAWPAGAGGWTAPGGTTPGFGPGTIGAAPGSPADPLSPMAWLSGLMPPVAPAPIPPPPATSSAGPPPDPAAPDEATTPAPEIRALQAQMAALAAELAALREQRDEPTP